MAVRQRQLISFDWALKRVLRSKTNHKVLEGFLSELLGEDVVIVEILESEGNRERAKDRSNRVDLLVRDSRGRRVLIEVQYAREGDYFHRMLYGVSKVITESLDIGQRYGEITRVISVNIVYFDIGQGQDYVYSGSTEFRGLHGHDTLELSADQRRLFTAATVSELFPQYYILKVNNFNAVAKTGLDEWVRFLKTGEISARCRARGLREAKSALALLKLSDAERRAYEAFIKEQRIAAGVAQSTIFSLEQAEQERAQAEQARAQAEQARAQAEQARAQAEQERAQAEQARTQAEQEAAEAQRQTAQAQRKAEEARREATAAQRGTAQARREAAAERRQKKAVLANAIAALMATGMGEDAARRLLDPERQLFDT